MLRAALEQHAGPITDTEFKAITDMAKADIWANRCLRHKRTTPGQALQIMWTCLKVLRRCT